MQAPAAATAKNLSHLLPSELIDKCIGSHIWVRGAVPPRPHPGGGLGRNAFHLTE